MCTLITCDHSVQMVDRRWTQTRLDLSFFLPGDEVQEVVVVWTHPHHRKSAFSDNITIWPLSKVVDSKLMILINAILGSFHGAPSASPMAEAEDWARGLRWRGPQVEVRPHFYISEHDGEAGVVIAVTIVLAASVLSRGCLLSLCGHTITVYQSRAVTSQPPQSEKITWCRDAERILYLRTSLSTVDFSIVTMYESRNTYFSWIDKRVLRAVVCVSWSWLELSGFKMSKWSILCSEYNQLDLDRACTNIIQSFYLSSHVSVLSVFYNY